MSYFHNGMLSPDADNPVKFTDLKRPSQTILLSEKDGMAEASAVGANASITTNAAIAGAFATDRHFLGSQHKVGVLMADGHGAEYGRAAVISGTDSGRQIIWWTND
jgi:hypothetical protein